MAFIDRPPVEPEKLRIDLQGPDGNAYVLLSIANRLATNLGWEKPRINNMLAEMKERDYEHLLLVLNKHLGDHLDLVLPHNFTWSHQGEVEVASKNPAADLQDSPVVWSPSAMPSKPKARP